MNIFRRIACSAAGLTAAAVVAGCGSTVTANYGPAEVDVRKLDIGSYHTEPNDLRFDYAPTFNSAQYLAVMRLADAVATGPEIDAKLDYGIGAGAITRPEDAVNAKFASSLAPVLGKYGMLYGFSSASSDKMDNPGAMDGDTGVAMTVFQFPDENAAAAAAKEFEAVDFDIARDQNQSVALPKYSQALSHWRPGVRTLGTRMARGSYVLNITVRTPQNDISALTALAERVYDMQLPLLDALPPLTKREILHLPYDAAGILRRTFHPDVTFGPVVPSEMSVSRRGFIHFLGVGKNKAKTMVDDAGVDAIGIVGKDILTWRTPDRKSAEKLAEQLRGSNHKLLESPRGVPDSSCWEASSGAPSMFAARNFTCLVRYDRYVGEVSSSQLLDTQQRAAAQFALFANSSW
ncbi:DUF7373 family lipoprotein [Nocardia blacklockiae]|uniref:DUF7373 family lipoprotein n=1 Tax=Nocardia blacklockiae TaxID=480036 RepID=UPI003F6A381C